MYVKRWKKKLKYNTPINSSSDDDEDEDDESEDDDDDDDDDDSSDEEEEDLTTKVNNLLDNIPKKKLAKMSEKQLENYIIKHLK